MEPCVVSLKLSIKILFYFQGVESSFSLDRPRRGVIIYYYEGRNKSINILYGKTGVNRRFRGKC